MWIPTEEDRQELTDPFHRSTIGRFTVEVKWKQTDQPSGLFTCRVLLDNKYTYEEIETDDPGKMMSWTLRQMKEVARRSGVKLESLDVRGVLAGEAPGDSSER